MSSAKELESDRKKHDKRWTPIGNSRDGMKPQDNFIVDTSDPVAKDFGFGMQHYNVQKKKLEKR